MSIQVSYTGGTGNGASLPTSPTQLLHVKIEITNQNQTASLSFEQSLMVHQQVQDDNSTEYGPVTASDTDDGVLPVELSFFSASVNINNVNLNWKTATEVNNNGFEIQREVSGQWERVGFVQGHGNSNSPKEYSFTDKNLTGGTVFVYRLKQIDNDGQYQYSKEVEIENIPEHYILYQNYPNPFNPSTTIKYAIPFESSVEIIIYNTIGQKVEEFNEGRKDAGYYDVVWQPKNLSSGIYFYSIIAKGTDGKNNYTKTLKMLLMK